MSGYGTSCRETVAIGLKQIRPATDKETTKAIQSYGEEEMRKLNDPLRHGRGTLVVATLGDAASRE